MEAATAVHTRERSPHLAHTVEREDEHAERECDTGQTTAAGVVSLMVLRRLVRRRTIPDRRTNGPRNGVGGARSRSSRHRLGFAHLPRLRHPGGRRRCKERTDPLRSQGGHDKSSAQCRLPIGWPSLSASRSSPTECCSAPEAKASFTTVTKSAPKSIFSASNMNELPPARTRWPGRPRQRRETAAFSTMRNRVISLRNDQDPACELQPFASKQRLLLVAWDLGSLKEHHESCSETSF